MIATHEMATALSSLLDLPAKLAALDAKLKELDAKLDELRHRDDTLMPLGKVLGVSTKAAHMRLVRDPELRKLGVLVGKRLLFKRAVVEAYFGERTRGDS